ncbi:MAG: hypothetical protein MI974_25200 [Chitinophagales bacterium]|nr:hypothetical protein [Chitinophagales bacterium]
MKRLLTLVFVLTVYVSFSQTIKEMYPALGNFIDKSPAGEVEYIKGKQQCELLYEKITDYNDLEKLSKAERSLYDNICNDEKESYWDVIGAGCSWYCGGGLDTLSASSSLKAYRGITYSSSNAHDLSYKTAWVEGVEGYGIGESITYHFPPQNPRITEIIIVNGYVKSEKAWKDNSRVKILKMYLNGQAFAILHLQDTRREQHFSFEPIGNAGRANWEQLISKPWWTIDFEIMEVYKGDKYADTAITEIYFNGIDVH